MRYFYHPEAGAAVLRLSDANIAHARARRLKAGMVVDFAALDGWLHSYELGELGRRASATWLGKTPFVARPNGSEIALANIEPAGLLEIAPYLNELGLERLWLVRCERSQGGYELDEKRQNKLRTLLCNSSEQCARADVLQIKQCGGLSELESECKKQVVLIDFSGENCAEFSAKSLENQLYVIGPEGGFSQREIETYKCVKLRAQNILKAKTAAIAAAAAMLI